MSAAARGASASRTPPATSGRGAGRLRDRATSGVSASVTTPTTTLPNSRKPANSCTPGSSGHTPTAAWAAIAPTLQSSEVRIDSIQLAVNAVAADDSSASEPIRGRGASRERRLWAGTAASVHGIGGLKAFALERPNDSFHFSHLVQNEWSGDGNRIAEVHRGRSLA